MKTEIENMIISCRALLYESIKITTPTHRLLDGIDKLKAHHAVNEQQYQLDISTARSAKAGELHLNNLIYIMRTIIVNILDNQYPGEGSNSYVCAYTVTYLQHARYTRFTHIHPFTHHHQL